VEYSITAKHSLIEASSLQKVQQLKASGGHGHLVTAEPDASLSLQHSIHPNITSFLVLMTNAISSNSEGLTNSNSVKLFPGGSRWCHFHGSDPECDLSDVFSI
jgi:hypothetical protein